MEEEQAGPAPREQRDIFISYASEDRDRLARPLAHVLRELGVSVWYDEFELRIGDNLRRRLDEGLSGSRYGVVLISTAFFGKRFPNHELDGLLQREVDGSKVILPVWVDVTEEHVRQYSPSLANRIAARWDEGLAVVAAKIITESRPDILSQMVERQASRDVPRARTGQDLSSAFSRAMASYPIYDEPSSQEELDLIAGFVQSVSDWSEIWNDIEVGARMEAEFSMTKAVRDVEAAGWSVFARPVRAKVTFAGKQEELPAFVLAVVRGVPQAVSFEDGKLAVLRDTVDQETARDH